MVKIEEKTTCPKCKGYFQTIYVRESGGRRYFVKIGKLCLSCFYIYFTQCREDYIGTFPYVGKG